jgi:hypothetical protein
MPINVGQALVIDDQNLRCGHVAFPQKVDRRFGAAVAKVTLRLRNPRVPIERTLLGRCAYARGYPTVCTKVTNCWCGSRKF